MILYENNALTFRSDVEGNRIVQKIEEAFEKQMGKKAPVGEKTAWQNSLRCMKDAVNNANVPNDCGVLVEYNIPATSKRIDFIITGHDNEDKSNFIIVELKQWAQAEATDKEYIVRTFLGGGFRETTHPCYQAYSYKKYLNDMNSAVYDKGIRTLSCAYLHNYIEQNPEPLLQNQYKEIVDDTPVFFAYDTERLQEFIRKYVGKGKGMEILYEIENGKICPSRKFVEYVSDIFNGNPVYTLLDEQMHAYATILNRALNARKKTAIIINGGPGTGKSVVAMNAFVSLLNRGHNVRFIAPNASFRECMVDTLGKKNKKDKKRIAALFSGSTKFVDSHNNEFDILIVDEAHRLKKKGAYMYKGESQVADIIKAAYVSVFFVDDRQKVRPDDEGSVARIKEVCDKIGANVEMVELKAQFRCSGADGYMNWVDSVLQIEETGNFDGWDKGTFEFKIFDSPNDMYQAISEKNAQGLKARMVAGYAWQWTSEKAGNDNAQAFDVRIDEYDFSMPWNSRKNQTTFATDESRINQVGCIHTTQGLEFDYVGVIIGKDLQYNPETKEVFGSYDNYCDSTGKKGLKDKPEQLTEYIKNIYKVLMSRGMKGCYVFCCDEELGKYFKQRAGK